MTLVYRVITVIMACDEIQLGPFLYVATHISLTETNNVYTATEWSILFNLSKYIQRLGPLLRYVLSNSDRALISLPQFGPAQITLYLPTYPWVFGYPWEELAATGRYVSYSGYITSKQENFEANVLVIVFLCYYKKITQPLIKGDIRIYQRKF